VYSKTSSRKARLAVTAAAARQHLEYQEIGRVGGLADIGGKRVAEMWQRPQRLGTARIEHGVLGRARRFGQPLPVALAKSRRDAQRQRHDPADLAPALGHERPGKAIQRGRRDRSQRGSFRSCALDAIDLPGGQEAGTRTRIQTQTNQRLLLLGQHSAHYIGRCTR
jgi:hypothetical protein